MTIMGTIVLALGALLLLAGTFLCVLSHDKFKPLIIRGCLHDAGIACIGLACPSAAAAWRAVLSMPSRLMSLVYA